MKYWMQSARRRMEARGTVGDLHRALGIPRDRPITNAQLIAAWRRAKRSGNTRLLRMILFAANARGLKLPKVREQQARSAAAAIRRRRRRRRAA